MTTLSREQLYKKFFKQDLSEMNDMFSYAFTPVIELFKYKTSPLSVLLSEEEKFQSLALAMRSYIEKNEKNFRCHFSIIDYLAYDKKEEQIEYLSIHLKRNDFSFNSNILDFIFLQKKWDQLNQDEQNIIKLFTQEVRLNQKYDGLDEIDLTIKKPNLDMISMVFTYHYPHDGNKIKENDIDYFVNIFKVYENDIKQFLSNPSINKQDIDEMLSSISSYFLDSCYNFWLKKDDAYLPIIEFFQILGIDNLNEFPKTSKMLAFNTPVLCFLKLYQNNFVDIKIEDLAKLNYYTVDKNVQQFWQGDYGQYKAPICYIGSMEDLFLKFSHQKKELMEALFVQCDDYSLFDILKKYENSYQINDIPSFFKPREGDSSLDYISQFLFEEGKIESLSFLISKKPELFQYIEQKTIDKSLSKSNYKDLTKVEQVYLNSINNVQIIDKKQRQKI
jgi:hypothetical protein